MEMAPKIQPAPPPNLVRPPVITPKIDTSRLAGEKDTAANPERVPQETATTNQSLPKVARQSPRPPAAARVSRAPLPQARPDLLAGVDASGLIDANQARGAAEAREAAGVGVERSDLSGLGDPLRGDDGGGPEEPRIGGLTPDEFRECLGLRGMKSPDEIAAGLATEFNDLGNRGVSSPAGDFTAGAWLDPSKLPRGDLAADKGHPNPDGSATLPTNDTSVRQSVWHISGNTATRVTVKEHSNGTTIHIVESVNSHSLRTTRDVVESRGSETVSHRSVTWDAAGNVVRDDDLCPECGVAEFQTREGAPGGIGGCAPSDGSAACQEWRRLMREGNSPARMLAGATRVSPGDPDDGTGSGPRITLSPDDLLGNPDPNDLGRGGAGRGARSFDGGTLVNDEGGGTGGGLGQ